MEARTPAGWTPGGVASVHPVSTRLPARTGGPAGYVGEVFRSLAARLAPTISREAPATAAGVPRAAEAVRFIVLAMVLVTVPLATPHPGEGTRGVAVAVTLGLSAIACVIWLFAGRGQHPVVVPALAVMGAAGGALAGVSSLSPAVAVGCMVTSAAGARLETEASLAITAETVAAFLIAGIATGASVGTLAGYPAAFIGLWAFGLTRRAYVLRAQEAEEALEQARRAHKAETQAAALAERARIAREIHDVLAHSLGAVSVNLQAAEGLLAAVPQQSAELTKAIECIERAGAFTREGLGEARRAILALRDTGTAPVDPLAEQLQALAAEYRADGDLAVDFSVTGEPRPLGAEAGLTAYRTVQEALTNARKHAPGQPVSLTLRFGPAETTVEVVNPLPPDGTAGPLAHTGTGYGLTGLRERAALSGGTLTAGPAGGQWQVWLTIPA
jgi:signal transduction histidine kinase